MKKLIVLAQVLVWFWGAVAPVAPAQTWNQYQITATSPPEYVLNSLVQIQVVADGESRVVGSGVIVRSDGLILTAYHLVAGAPAIGVRLRNGQVFDHAEIVATDAGRNVAVLSIPAANLNTVSTAQFEETSVGSAVMLLATNSPENTVPGVLTSVMLADEVPGAGTGYRILKFNLKSGAAESGGLLVDRLGRPLGLLAAPPQAQSQNYAVPFSSLTGLIHSIGVKQTPPPPAVALNPNAPFLIPQGSVSVPQRGVLPLAAKGPGSVVVPRARPVDVLLSSKTIFVESYTENFAPDQLVNELTSKSEMNDWGLSFVDEKEVADLVLTLDHILFTWKFTFKLVHQRTGVVVASGDVIIWDGNLGAPHMADRVIEKLKKVREQKPTPVAPPPVAVPAMPAVAKPNTGADPK